MTPPPKLDTIQLVIVGAGDDSTPAVEVSCAKPFAPKPTAEEATRDPVNVDYEAQERM